MSLLHKLVIRSYFLKIILSILSFRELKKLIQPLQFQKLFLLLKCRGLWQRYYS